jgi:hypothetical protein
VEASSPVSSASRLAARPVGAASTTVAFLAVGELDKQRMMQLLPQPGRPVSTATLLLTASFDRLLLLLGCQVLAGPAPQPAFGPVERHQVNRRNATPCGVVVGRHRLTDHAFVGGDLIQAGAGQLPSTSRILAASRIRLGSGR